ncbi:ABC transporter substrate-binding protein [Myxococcus sp. RHSTA-1-4]|uniref:ABC transporter substrate-binding protein n=1 Tax=Myxococcus sp. RHSTA-1-4 TaxID=2874601 RepID=UPI001CBF64EB|nr:ABC transporter substrate-binding protein [Myxococcus sp. RHSTA-1-4]MBZ4423144.1 ABC transporter substrate-binding protein [Myxococcus sp. RHSTA-1-4]
MDTVSTFGRAALLALVLLGGGACEPLDAREYTPAEDSITLGVIETRIPRRTGFAARLAAQEINLAGGVLGRRVEIIVAQDRLCDADHSPEVVRGLLERGGVAIIPATCSAATRSSLDVVAPEAANVVLVAPTSSSATLTGLPNFYRTIANDEQQAPLLADEVRRQGVDNAALVHVDDIYGIGLANGFERRFTQLGGRILARVAHPTGKTTGFTDEVQRIYAAGKPQAIVIMGFSVGAAGLSRDLAASADISGVRFFASEAVFGPGFLTSADATVAQGMQGLVPTAPLDDPNWLRFVASYEAATGETFDIEDAGRLQRTYDAVYLLALAMAKGGAATTEAIRDNIIAVSGTRNAVGTPVNVGEFASALELLRAGQEVNYEGASGPLDLDENGEPFRGTYLLWRIDGGQFVFDKALRFP